MRLSEICVQRPVFAFMLIMFLVVMGVFSFCRLGCRPVPAQRSGDGLRPGRAARRESGGGHLAGGHAARRGHRVGERHRRDARHGVAKAAATIIVTFVLERDIGEAAEDVREKVSGAMRSLPPNVLPPTVAKADPDSDPIITLAVSGTRSVARVDRDRRQADPARAGDRGRRGGVSTSAAAQRARSTSSWIWTS